MTIFGLVETMSGRSRHVHLNHHVAERIASPRTYQKIRDERLSLFQAADRLDLSRSQVHRLLQAYDREGRPGSLRRSNHGLAIGATARNFAMRRWI